MSKVLELSEDTYEGLRVLAQQRQCTLEELIHTFLVDYEQVQYYQANQQMLAQDSGVHPADLIWLRSGLHAG
jgi:hypothetical protein